MLQKIEVAKSPATINLVLKRMKKVGREFLPNDMMVFLKTTNHHLSIRDMLKNIPAGKEADFKEAILTMVEGRVHTEVNLERIREIAKIGGFSEELEEVHAKEKCIGNTYVPDKKLVIKSVDEFKAKKEEFKDYEELVVDFSADGSDGEIKISDVTEMPKSVEFIGCHKVAFENYDDKTGYKRIDLSNHHLKFENCNSLKMVNVVPPEDLDLSCLDQVKVWESDLSLFNLNHKNLWLEIVDCSMWGSNKVLDVSLTENTKICSCVDSFDEVIAGNQFEVMESRGFREISNRKVQLDLENTKSASINCILPNNVNLVNYENCNDIRFLTNIPFDVDLSKNKNIQYVGEINDKLSCAKFNPDETIQLYGGILFYSYNANVWNHNFSNINNVMLLDYELKEHITFKEGGTVAICSCKLGESYRDRPVQYDFSPCEKVTIDDDTLKNIGYSKFILRDKKQRDEIFGRCIPEKVRFEYKNDKFNNILAKIKERF